MADNPFLGGQGPRPGRETRESLEAYAEELNRMAWVRASGQPYFVNRRLDEKTNEYKHFLDRKIA